MSRFELDYKLYVFYYTLNNKPLRKNHNKIPDEILMFRCLCISFVVIIVYSQYTASINSQLYGSHTYYVDISKHKS